MKQAVKRFIANSNCIAEWSDSDQVYVGKVENPDGSFDELTHGKSPKAALKKLERVLTEIESDHR